MGIILNLSLLFAFVAVISGEDADDNMDVITASNFHKFLKGAESGPKSARVGRGYQDQAFVVGTGYKVSDGVLDGSFGGVTHTAKGIVLGYDHEGPHHITSLRRGHNHKQNYYRPQPQQAPAYYNNNPYANNYPNKYGAMRDQKYAFYGQGSKYGGYYGGQGGYGQSGDSGIYGYDSPAFAAVQDYAPALGDQRNLGYYDGRNGGSGPTQVNPRPASYNRGVAKVYHSGNHLDSLRGIYGQNSYAFTI